MRVVVAKHKDRAPGATFTSLSFDDLLSTADVVSLHMPLTPVTRACIGARELARMKSSAFLINTARGALIDQAALRDALAAKRLAGFAADVLVDEPPSADDPLLGSERVLLTPHVASLTAATYRAMCIETAKNVIAVLRGEKPAARSVFT
jgi:phosphoglycerate dehydrogenase-like enzyme